MLFFGFEFDIAVDAEMNGNEFTVTVFGQSLFLCVFPPTHRTAGFFIRFAFAHIFLRSVPTINVTSIIANRFSEGVTLNSNNS
jgi:hypothetical protein